MAYADPIKQREYNKTYLKQHYLDNKQYYKDKKKRYALENFQKLNQYKDQPCMDCGLKYPSYIMDFDHRENKSFNISMRVKTGLSFNRILEEIAKCDLVCSNCHRERTYQRLQSGQTGKVTSP